MAKEINKVCVTNLKRSFLELHDGGVVHTHALGVDEDRRKAAVVGVIPQSANRLPGVGQACGVYWEAELCKEH